MPRDRLVGARDHGGGRLATRDLLGQVGSADHRDPLGARAGHLGDHLAHPLEGAELDALHQRHQHRPVRQDRRPVLEVRPQGLRRYGEHDDVGPGRGLLGVVGGRDVLGQLDAGQVVGVLAGLGDGRGDLLAPRPQGDLVAGVGQHDRERRAPGPGAEHRDLVVRVHDLPCLRGSPVSLTPALRGSNRQGRRLLAADLLDQHGERGHDPVGGGVDHLLGAGQLDEVVEGYGRPGEHLDVLAGEGVRRLRVRRQQLVCPPLPDRDHRTPGLQGDARGAGLAGHRPQVRVTRQRALRVDDDALAGTHGGDGGVVRALGVAAQPLDGDLAGAAEELAEGLVLEEAGLREVPRQPAVVVEEVRGRQRVEVRDVVEHHDAATGGRDVLAATPRAPRRGQQRRLDDGHGQVVRPASRLLQVADGHARRLLGAGP